MLLSMVLNAAHLKHTLLFLCAFLSFYLLCVELCLMNVGRALKWTLLYYLCIFDLESWVLYFCHVIFPSHLFLLKYIYFPCSCSQSRWKIGGTEREEWSEREMERERCLFFSPLFITIVNQDLRGSLLHPVDSLPVLSFLSNTKRLHSHSLYLFIYFIILHFFLSASEFLKVTCQSHWQQLLYLCLVFGYIFFLIEELFSLWLYLNMLLFFKHTLSVLKKKLTKRCTEVQRQEKRVCCELVRRLSGEAGEPLFFGKRLTTSST